MCGTMILVRTMTLAKSAIELAASLKAASNLPVVMLIDERRGSAGDCVYPKLSLNQAAYTHLQIHRPWDVGWRCGDYGFYLARTAFPEVERFWMIEDDVRISGDAGRFFDFFAARPEPDLLAARLRPADRNWWWWAHLSSTDAEPWRCFFPVVRLSARAIDALHLKRRAHSRSPSRVALWPNDEAFVATTVNQHGLACADLNGFGVSFYDDATFSYENVLRDESGEAARADGPPRLLHPVLSGQAYERKLARLRDMRERSSLGARVKRALVRRVNKLLAW